MFQDIFGQNVGVIRERIIIPPLEYLFGEMVFMEMAGKYINVLAATWVNDASHGIGRIQPVVKD